MKKFLNIFIFFCLPVFVIGFSLEVLLRHIPNGYQVKSDYLITHQESIKTLLVGSSHILYGINPVFLSKEALNYGNVSQTIDIDYGIIHQNLNNLEALETVVLRLSYTTLFEQLKHGNESWRLKDYTLYTTVDLDSKLKYNFEILSVKLKYNLERIYNYYILKENFELVNKTGWGRSKVYDSTANIDEVGILIAKKHTITNDELYVENLKILESIIEECKEKGVKVILVTMPAYTSYVQHLDQDQLEKTISAGLFMQNNFTNCSYFNFLEDKRFGTQDFLDADHLNEYGAEKFSKVIDSILSQ
ncbi:hypothetical protein [Formosa sp. PL04]|uniref:hypothetical protein n=1 Tax=Formosa sp. PL04 TaxID=3081755 RepID=UPI0029813ABC|nr:hypothetical protein [Formosa sp. PL04]MDW5288845.1 hypothetical protein [Formosa sp. PL04]